MKRIGWLVILLCFCTTLFAQGKLPWVMKSAPTAVTITPAVAPTNVPSRITKSKDKIWADYYAAKNVRDLAANAQDTKEVTRQILKMNDLLEQLLQLPLTTAEVAVINNNLAWQLNNVGFNIIAEFKLRTDYVANNRRLGEIVSRKDKLAFLATFKLACKKELPFLEEAESYLLAALTIDGKGPWVDTKARKKLIESNLNFIDWVRNFCAD